MKKAILMAAVAGLAASSAAFAIPVPLDKNYNVVHEPALALNDGGVTTSTITVPDNGLIDTFDYIYIDISHTWVGDIVIRLDSPAGAGVVLLDRPGVPASTFGNDDDLDGIYRFEMGGLVFPELGGSGVVEADDIYAPVDSFDRFNNTQKEGVWTLTITDFATPDAGVLRGWGFGVTNIPAPGALALLGLGGLAAARRRR
jgi:subtilisin-like proprotein convertase family protein